MRAFERFIEYVKINSAGDEAAESVPSTPGQIDMANFLARELKSLGMEEVYADGHAYVYGRITADAGFENAPTLGLIAHLDTIPDFSGENVAPRVIEGYDGGDVTLGESGRVLSVEKFPHLPSLKGQTLICTDGTTVLGADDKAGIAEILTACERVKEEKRPHGPIAVCFTPDEEIGHGAALLDLKRLGADFAFTVDGGELNEVEYETFNAATARFDVSGFNVHPGSAKGIMINANTVAMEINSLLPADETPEKTEGRQGFFHLTDMKGSVESAFLSYIVRDHDANAFSRRKILLMSIEKRINEKYGAGTAKLTIKEQYRNMAEILAHKKEITELARNAVRQAGLTPETPPVRGGTDGSQLSFRGLPCPNIGTGGYAFHGPYEHITAERMDTAVDIILGIIEGAGKMRAD